MLGCAGLAGLVTMRSFVRPVTVADSAAVAAYDRQYVATDCSPFLAAWLAPSATGQTEGYFEDGVLRGHGTVHRCVEGWKIGPLFANDPAIADTLLATLVTPAGTHPVFIDIPEPNDAARDVAIRLG